MKPSILYIKYILNTSDIHHNRAHDSYTKPEHFHNINTIFHQILTYGLGGVFALGLVKQVYSITSVGMYIMQIINLQDL